MIHPGMLAVQELTSVYLARIIQEDASLGAPASSRQTSATGPVAARGCAAGDRGRLEAGAPRGTFMATAPVMNNPQGLCIVVDAVGLLGARAARPHGSHPHRSALPTVLDAIRAPGRAVSPSYSRSCRTWRMAVSYSVLTHFGSARQCRHCGGQPSRTYATSIAAGSAADGSVARTSKPDATLMVAKNRLSPRGLTANG